MASNCRQRAGNFLSRERLLKQSSEQLEPSLTYQRPRYGMPIVYTNINCVHRSAPSLLSLSGYYAEWRSVGMLMTRDAVVTLKLSAPSEYKPLCPLFPPLSRRRHVYGVCLSLIDLFLAHHLPENKA